MFWASLMPSLQNPSQSPDLIFPKNIIKSGMTYKVAALYRFVAMTDLPVHQQVLNDIRAQFDLCGTFVDCPKALTEQLPAAMVALMLFWTILKPF